MAVFESYLLLMGIDGARIDAFVLLGLARKARPEPEVVQAAFARRCARLEVLAGCLPPLVRAFLHQALERAGTRLAASGGWEAERRMQAWIERFTGPAADDVHPTLHERAFAAGCRARDGWTELRQLARQSSPLSQWETRGPALLEAMRRALRNAQLLYWRRGALGYARVPDEERRVAAWLAGIDDLLERLAGMDGAAARALFQDFVRRRPVSSAQIVRNLPELGYLWRLGIDQHDPDDLTLLGLPVGPHDPELQSAVFRMQTARLPNPLSSSRPWFIRFLRWRLGQARKNLMEAASYERALAAHLMATGAKESNARQRAWLATVALASERVERAVAKARDRHICLQAQLDPLQEDRCRVLLPGLLRALREAADYLRVCDVEPEHRVEGHAWVDPLLSKTTDLQRWLADPKLDSATRRALWLEFARG